MTTREALIASTQELLWTRGYTGMSPRAILTHSGVGQGSLYHHFNGKADLTRVAIERTAERMKARVATCLNSNRRPIDRIMAFLNDEREILRGCPIGRLTADPEITTDDVFRTIIAETLQRSRSLLIKTIQEAVAVEELEEDISPPALADLILSTVQGAFILAKAETSEKPYFSAIAGLAMLLSKSS